MHAHDSDWPTDTKRIVTSSNLESKEPFTELVAVKVNENKLKSTKHVQSRYLNGSPEKGSIFKHSKTELFKSTRA